MSRPIIEPTCSFCGKKEREVLRLLAKGEVMICDECVQYCVEVIVCDPTRPGTRKWLAWLKRRIARAELEPAPQSHNLISIGAARAQM
jgi:ATP-dependent protease Clp ATPase subunit